MAKRDRSWECQWEQHWLREGADLRGRIKDDADGLIEVDVSGMIEDDFDGGDDDDGDK